MADLTWLVRVSASGSYNPPRRAAGLVCNEAPATIILQLGKAPRAKILSTSFKIDVKRYMTKRQKELAQDE